MLCTLKESPSSPTKIQRRETFCRCCEQGFDWHHALTLGPHPIGGEVDDLQRTDVMEPVQRLEERADIARADTLTHMRKRGPPLLSFLVFL